MGKSKKSKSPIVYFHFCDGCGILIIDFEIKDTHRGDKIVDAYCPTCEKKDPLVGLFCKVIGGEC